MLGALNFAGTKGSGRLQVYLVVVLLLLLAGFISGGLGAVQLPNFESAFQIALPQLMATTGLVYISYAGVTNVASLSEEVQNPEKTCRGPYFSR